MGMVPVSQNPGVSSTVNTQSTSQPQDHNSDPCRKCGKKNHTTDKCKKKASCKKCKSKEHNTKFCTENPTPDLICSLCGKKGIHLRTAEPTRKLRRRLGHKSQSLPEAMCQTHQQQLLDRHKAIPLQHQVQQDPRCKNKFLHSWYPH